MSIVALKRRAKLINNQSGKEPSARLIVRGPGQTEGRVITTGGGFSLNGPYRNIGYVGKNSLDSVGGTRMKPGTSTWIGPVQSGILVSASDAAVNQGIYTAKLLSQVMDGKKPGSSGNLGRWNWI